METDLGGHKFLKRFAPIIHMLGLNNSVFETIQGDAERNRWRQRARTILSNQVAPNFNAISKLQAGSEKLVLVSKCYNAQTSSARRTGRFSPMRLPLMLAERRSASVYILLCACTSVSAVKIIICLLHKIKKKYLGARNEINEKTFGSTNSKDQPVMGLGLRIGQGR